jgi:sugar lactone lactonase YvrE
MADGQIISTIAGDSSSMYNGDGIAGTMASLYNPSGVVVDGTGNIYIADGSHNRIRKINTNGIIITICGTGIAGYNGDGISATNAEINYPSRIALDKNGNIYVCDDHNFRIRMVDTSGIIYTIAGTGISGYNGDNIASTLAQITGSDGIAVDDNGNVYIGDISNHRIRKISPAIGGIITTIAGTGTIGYSGDGGPATLAQLYQPFGIALDKIGNLYEAEYGNYCVRKINTAGIISTIAGNGTRGSSGDGLAATLGQFDWPSGISVDGFGNIYIADVSNNKIRKVDNSGIITTIAGNGSGGFSGDGGLAIDAELASPDDVYPDKNGNLYIADWGNNRIRYIRNTVFVNLIKFTEPSISIYPNPTKGIFYVKLLSGINAIVPISIKDVLGNEVLEVDLFTNQISTIKIDVPAGVYFLSATYFGERWYDKIIVN